MRITKLENQIRFLIKITHYIVLKLIKERKFFRFFTKHQGTKFFVINMYKFDSKFNHIKNTLVIRD